MSTSFVAQAHSNMNGTSPQGDMDQNSICPGCKRSVVDETGGVVVAFGSSFFHVDCFKCAKCNNQVTADTNLLLLSDGSPICSNCSYGCNVCGLPILDEAIMTGDDSYHAHCFKCKVCKNRIDELVFAKTSQGIYCMPCHSERVAQSRKRAQKRAEEKARLKALEAGGGLSRESSAQSVSQSQGPRNPPKPSSSHGPSSLSNSRTPEPRRNNSLQPGSSDTSPNDDKTRPLGPRPAATPIHQSRSASNSEQNVLSSSQRRSRDKPAESVDLLKPAAPNALERRKSYEDRPLNMLFGGSSDPSGSSNGTVNGANGVKGLTVPTSRQRKRQSINPLSIAGMAPILDQPTSLSPPTSSGLAPAPPPYAKDSPQIHSPGRQYFPESNTTSLAATPTHTGFSTPSHSQPTTPAMLERDRSFSEAIDRTNSASPRPRNRNITLERVPPRNASLIRPALVSHSSSDGAVGTGNGRFSPGAHRSRFEDIARPIAAGRLSPSESPDHEQPGAGSRPISQHSTSSRRSARSPHVDVPQGVESGTDTENELEGSGPSEEDHPPALPPKELKEGTSTPRPSPPNAPAIGAADLSVDTSAANASYASTDGAGDESVDESSPVERTSMATYIAPALPPIRFSMSGADFSELLKNVEDGTSTVKALEKLALGSVPEGVAIQAPPSVPGSEQSESEPSTPQTSEGPGSQLNLGPADVLPLSKPTAPLVVTELDKTPTKMPRRASEAAPYSPSASRSRTSSESNLLAQPTLLVHTPAPGLSRSRSARQPQPKINVTGPGGSSVKVPKDNAEIMTRKLQAVLTDVHEHGAADIRLETSFLEAILEVMKQRNQEHAELKSTLEGMKRASQQYVAGLTVAQTEYDKEVKARREAEAEKSRLRVLLTGQAARLSAMSGSSRKQEVQEQLSQDLSNKISGLAQDVSKLKVERDITLAEVEELSASKTSAPDGAESNTGVYATRSLSMRLDNIKGQYKRDLVQLNEQRETLTREIAELKASREVYLEETTALNARNEELAKLSAEYARRAEDAAVASSSSAPSSQDDQPPTPPNKKSSSFERPRVLPMGAHPGQSTTSLSASTTGFSEESGDAKYIKVHKPETPESTPQIKTGKFLKWPGPKPTKDPIVVSLPIADRRGGMSSSSEHNFQQLNALRFARCDHCGDKIMFGSQFRCTSCQMSVHARCVNNVIGICQGPANGHRHDDSGKIEPLAPSMFGRSLIEQAQADAQRDGTERAVPVIVEKCIDAVEALAMDYEGIYRKTGGSGQTKMITQLFERGDYNAFDLQDMDRFNDINSVTSVLKSYFRMLPDPLLTHELHSDFMEATRIRDPEARIARMRDLVGYLPGEHYYTVRMLMLHLHRIHLQSDENLMGSRNLGVVFGPTLMKSRDPAAEFVDMAGKAVTVEWFVEHAPALFDEQ